MLHDDLTSSIGLYFYIMKRLQIGIISMLASCMGFTVMSYAVKELSQVLTSADMLLLRSTFTTLFIIISIWCVKGLQPRTGNKKLLLVSRGIAGAIGVLLIFYCISISNLVITATFLQTTPLFIALLSYIWLKQKLTMYKVFAIALGFVGIICITQQVSFDLEVFLVGLAIGLSAAYAYTCVHKLSAYYETRIIILSFSIAGLVLGIILGLHNYLDMPTHSILNTSTLNTLTMWNWLLIFTIGISATLSQTFLTHAYSVAPAYIISTIGYATIPMTFVCDVWIYQQSFNWVNLLGICLVVISSIVVARR
jgi:drug/metabolite transporter (DMT)-like permease